MPHNPILPEEKEKRGEEEVNHTGEKLRFCEKIAVSGIGGRKRRGEKKRYPFNIPPFRGSCAKRERKGEITNRPPSVIMNAGDYKPSKEEKEEGKKN